MDCPDCRQPIPAEFREDVDEICVETCTNDGSGSQRSIGALYTCPSCGLAFRWSKGQPLRIIGNNSVFGFREELIDIDENYRDPFYNRHKGCGPQVAMPGDSDITVHPSLTAYPIPDIHW